MPFLRFTLPNSNEVTHVLAQERISIGRRPDNTIQIIDRSVSGYHAELILIDGHYRLHDLHSTNSSRVDGQLVTDYHLNASCRLSLGNVECAFDAAPNPEPAAHQLTPAQLERDAAFLRGENSELLGQIDVLQRRIDILSSARLVTGKSDTSPFGASSEALKAMTEERDDVRHRNVGLTLELERVREELAFTSRERDQLRETIERMGGGQTVPPRSVAERDLKSGTQRIDLPSSDGYGSSETEPTEPTRRFSDSPHWEEAPVTMR